MESKRTFAVYVREVEGGQDNGLLLPQPIYWDQVR
jgi:hypothetical protein